uniref:Reverse transcriptase Ty1/copia-type domain-containing protein n=1 Tax=Nicotiana tabacum TaxID=4097 RepID=A0A1S4CN75_TOBAC|nr:PREDICTED: uncharacterized protein LOC107820606 [Nicotiana tabacum]
MHEPQFYQLAATNLAWQEATLQEFQLLRYKARLVIRDDSQGEEIDFTETFSPVVKLTTIKCLLILVAKNKWTVFQLDVNNVVLHGDSMRRQASRQWFSKLSEALISRGYISSLNDYSLFTKSTADCLVVLAVYHFSSVPTLLDPSVKLTMDMGEPFSDPSLYRRLVEKLNFLQNTRPDMSFSVQRLSQFLHKPQVPHMISALHVLRYLINDLAQGALLCNFSNFSLLAYSDSDWTSCFSQVY